MNGLKLFAVVGLALFAGTAWGQVEVEWERTYDKLHFDECISMVKANDGGLILIGNVSENPDPDDSIWVVKTDPNGREAWSRTFGAYNRYPSCDAVICPDGGIAIGGTAEWLGYTFEFRLLKLNSDGDSLWSRTLGERRWNQCNGIVLTLDGGFAIVGETYNGSTNACLIRADSSGNTIWYREYDYIYPFLTATQLSDGGFALISGELYGEHHSFEIWHNSITRTDRDGEVLWSKSFENCSAFDLLETLDGNIAFVGSKKLDEQQLDMLFVKLNLDGDIMWWRSYGNVGHSDMCRSFIKLSDGGYALAGMTRSAESGFDGMMIRISPEGDSLWALRVDGEENCYFTSLIINDDNRYYVAGTEQNDYYLMKTTPDPVSVRNPVSPLMPSILLLFPAYPNPFNSTTRIDFGLSKLASTRLQIFDPLGRRIDEVLPIQMLNAGRHSAVWDATGVPAGEYLIRLQAGDQAQVTSVQVIK